MLPLALLLGVGMHTSWKKMAVSPLRQKLAWPAAFVAVFGITLPWLVFGTTTVLTAVAVCIGLWVVVSSLIDPVSRMFDKHSVGLTRGQWGMLIAHLGVGVFILGASVGSAYNVETDQAVSPGQVWQVAGYDIEFRSIRDVEGPNFIAEEGEFEVRRDGSFVATLRPQKRTYRVQTSPMTEAAIDAGLHRDIFIALGEPLGGGAWSVRVQFKPLIEFIWFGTVIMAFGGLLAASDRRYRQAVRKPAVSPATDPAAPAQAARGN